MIEHACVYTRIYILKMIYLIELMYSTLDLICLSHIPKTVCWLISCIVCI